MYKIHTLFGWLSAMLILIQLTACSGDDNNNEQNNNPPSNFPTVTLESGERIIFQENIRIPMRDGVTLSANIFRPLDSGEYPSVVAMTPYNKDDLPVEYDPEEGIIEVSDYAGFEIADPAFWVPHGYAIVTIDNRGMNLSEGNMSLLTNQEAEDYYDAIEWLASQEWSNGNIGLNGVSYMAINQWKVAAMAPPSLKAIMPWEGFTDVYRDLAYHGGIYNEDFLNSWWQFRILENKNPQSSDQDLPSIIEDTPLYEDIYTSLTPTNLSTIDIPAYIVASWPDHGLHTRGTILGYEEISSEYKWLEVHGRKKWEWYYSQDAQNRQLKFFDYFLAEEDNDMLSVPKVSYELRTSYYNGEMKTAETWPLPNFETNTLYIDTATGTLQTSPVSNLNSVSYNVSESDQSPLRQEFHYAFSEDTEITGSMNLRLWISVSDANDTDLFVGIQKYDAQGNVVYLHGNDIEEGQVANGWLRASHRVLDINRSTDTRPFHSHLTEELLIEDEIVAVEIEILPSSTLFRAGERLTLVIQGQDMEESGLYHNAITQGKVSIHSGENYPSSLIFRSKH